jgi:ADP-heptose:LPS heptosyltransferase
MVQARNKKSPDRILITRFSAVGDIAMTIPLLYSLAATYPEKRFIFVSRERFGQFLVNAPENLTFEGVNLDDYKGVGGLYRLKKRLMKHNPDAIADLHDVLRTKVLRMLLGMSGVKCASIEKGRAEKKRLTAADNRQRQQLKSTFERYHEVFKKLGLDFTPDFVSLFGSGKGDLATLGTALPAKGDTQWIGIAPFAKHGGKIYPTERLEKVIESLSTLPDLKIFCFGNGKEEAAVVDQWCSRFDNVISFIGKSDFRGELTLISNLELMVSMDSANMHIASLVGTPVISIWGATSPLAGFLGWRQKEEDCVQLPLDCRPCSIFGNKPCRSGDYKCMKIEPQTVVEKIKQRLGR